MPCFKQRDLLKRFQDVKLSLEEAEDPLERIKSNRSKVEDREHLVCLVELR